MNSFAVLLGILQAVQLGISDHFGLRFGQTQIHAPKIDGSDERATFVLTVMGVDYEIQIRKCRPSATEK